MLRNTGAVGPIADAPIASATKREFLAHQNRVRGAIARSKSKHFQLHQQRPLEALRSDLRRTYLSARAKLEESRFEEFLTWTDYILETTVPELSTFPVQYSYLSGFSSKTPIVSLGREITWIAKFLKNKASTISEYRCSSDQFCKHILLGNYELALATIDDISAKHGHSFYLIQLRLALEQKAFGLERQKEYAKSIRRQFKRGILSFVTYYTSVRVEDRTSWDGFVTMIDEKLSQSHHGDTLNGYLRYRLTNRWPNHASGVIDILRIEQNHLFIDLYETVISFLQHICDPDQSAYQECGRLL